MRRRASAPMRVRRALARDGDHDARPAPLEPCHAGGGLTCERRGLRPGDALFSAARLPIKILSTPPNSRPCPTRRLLTSTSPSDGPVRSYQLPTARCLPRSMSSSASAPAKGQLIFHSPVRQHRVNSSRGVLGEDGALRIDEGPSLLSATRLGACT
jgi:hypothetical protein